MAPTSAMWLIAILCFADLLSMQWQCKQAVALKCIIQFRCVTNAFCLCSDIARCLPPTPRSCTDSKENSTRTLFRCRVCSSILLILNKHTQWAMLYMHVSHVMHACMHAAVRVLHSSAFILSDISCYPLHVYADISSVLCLLHFYSTELFLPLVNAGTLIIAQ